MAYQVIAFKVGKEQFTRIQSGPFTDGNDQVCQAIRICPHMEQFAPTEQLSAREVTP
jgi:hypothetical protein